MSSKFLRLSCVIFAVVMAVGFVPVASSGEGSGDSGSVFWLVIFALVAIGFSFFCSIAEAVLLSVTPSYIATLEEQGSGSAALLGKLKKNIDRPLAAILSLNTIAHTAGAAGVGAQAASLWGSQAVGWASAIMTLLILVLSEIIPKTIGAVYWRSLAPWIARLVNVLILALYPLVLLSDSMTRLIGGNVKHVVTREEVAAMATLSEQGGQLESSESRILKNLFQLRSLTARDIMTPRPVIVAYPETMTVGELFDTHNDFPVSRIPVYDGTIDKVTGFVLKSDILLAQANDKPETKLSDLRRDLKTVVSTASLSELFDDLLKQREHVALVVDEYGGTDGLVTLEDLIETLLGTEIVDEADTTTDMQRLARREWERRANALGLDLSGLSNADVTPSGDSEPTDSQEE